MVPYRSPNFFIVDVMVSSAVDRDPAPIPPEAWDKAEQMLLIDKEQRNWSWLLNPRRSSIPPSLGEGSSRDSEEEDDVAIGDSSVAPAVSTEIPLPSVTLLIDEDAEEENVDPFLIKSRK